MKRKLDTSFPAARIKKIMQMDEDVGKVALAVPVLISKALELFLQELCDRTYSITLQRGVKTLNTLHLKQCVHSLSQFDFLKDAGSSDSVADDRPKRRQIVDEHSSTEEELKWCKSVSLTTDVSDSVAMLPEETLIPSSSTRAPVRDFDLNLDLENNGDAAPDMAKTSTISMIS
ncbi:DNA polymerase epsilon subunit C-like [Curcuma longa]|uniref:DNA polymerase epsilon subunit C-like n=1 Tax=Curcuma longa TaxID=136217 RepID=UPI003D9EFB77